MVQAGHQNLTDTVVKGNFHRKLVQKKVGGVKGSINLQPKVVGPPKASQKMSENFWQGQKVLEDVQLTRIDRDQRRRKKPKQNYTKNIQKSSWTQLRAALPWRDVPSNHCL